MTERKTQIIWAAWIFAVCTVFGMAVFFGCLQWSESLFYDKLAAVASAMPKESSLVMKALKDTEGFDLEAGRIILGKYGYHGQLSGQDRYTAVLLCGVLAGGVGAVVFLFFSNRERRKLCKRVGELTEYLRGVEEGDYSMSLERRQDFLSLLEDEIYKTVVTLRESRESLRMEKENLARDMADISHQFKTPLTSLSVLSELVLRRVTGEEVRMAVQKMESQTDRLSELCAALLTLSRADAGVLSFKIREVTAGELMECAMEAVRPLADKKEQRIEFAGREAEWEDISLSCDLGWTREALGNILKNASEHGPAGSVITIGICGNPIYTQITVEDQGPGFSAEDLPHLFERFYRGAGAERDSAGIGLSLAKSLIESQNGEIRAQNRREGGGRFVIKFYKNR